MAGWTGYPCIGTSEGVTCPRLALGMLDHASHGGSRCSTSPGPDGRGDRADVDQIGWAQRQNRRWCSPTARQQRGRQLPKSGAVHDQERWTSRAMEARRRGGEHESRPSSIRDKRSPTGSRRSTRHPEVYQAFAKFAAQMRARGYTHYLGGRHHVHRQVPRCGQSRSAMGLQDQQQLCRPVRAEAGRGGSELAGFFAISGGEDGMSNVEVKAGTGAG